MLYRPSGDSTNPISAMQGVDGCLAAFDTAMGCLLGAAQDYQAAGAYQRAVGAAHEMARDNADLRALVHRLLDEREQMQAKLESVRDVRLQLARAQMELAQLKRR